MIGRLFQPFLEPGKLSAKGVQLFTHPGKVC